MGGTLIFESNFKGIYKSALINVNINCITIKQNIYKIQNNNNNNVTSIVFKLF